MKPEKNIDELLDRYITSASTEDVESHCDQVFQQLQSRAQNAASHASPERHASWRAIGVVAAAAAIVLAVLVGVFFHAGAPAVLESENSRRIEYGETIHANDAAGSTLVLSDKSRVEMRAGSELSLERAEDGVRIRLNKGDVIVSAAKQHGHLYVQTKDVMVSVVGTVFLVNAEAEGSRVAVIEGEVHVRQGTTESKLRPGEQVKTNPLMGSQPVQEEISWSKNAVAHLALLGQSVAPSTGPQSSKEPRVAFEVASIRPSNPVPTGTGVRGGGDGRQATCADRGLPQIDPSRFSISGVTLYYLIVRAHGDWTYSRGSCGGVNRSSVLSGGPGWIKTDLWDIEARIPEGTPWHTAQEFGFGNAPELQRMLQTLLAERFKVVLRRETKDLPVYLLKVGTGGPRFNGNPIDSRSVFLGADGKLVSASDVEVHGMIRTTASKDQAGNSITVTGFTKVTMTALARWLYGSESRPVLDATGLTGEFDFRFDSPGGVPGVATGSGTSVSEQLERIGLELKDSKAPVEVWVIDHAEKPSEN